MANKWEIQMINGMGLSSLCGKGNDFFNIWEQIDYHDQFYYEIDSKCFNHITNTDINHAMSVIQGFSIIANGALTLKLKHIGKHIDLNYNRIFYDGTSISTFSYNWMPTMNPFNVIPYKHISKHTIKTSSAFDIVHASVKYEAIREILFQVGMCFEVPQYVNYSTWTTLYGITDTVFYYTNKEFKLDKKNTVTKLGLSNTEYNRFTGTANNFDYLGFYARHGKSTWTPPKKTDESRRSIQFRF